MKIEAKNALSQNFSYPGAFLIKRKTKILSTTK